MNPRKYPRTMQEAFGPYTSNQIHDPEKEPSKFMVWATSIAALVLIVIGIILPAFNEDQDTADALYEAQETIREECGGPEASFDQVAVGEFQCKTKNGKRSVTIKY